MKRIPFFLTLFLLTLTVTLTAQKPAPGTTPILDRDLFFGDPEISGAQLSPDGKFISFIKPLEGTRNIWVKSVDEPFDNARPLTGEKNRPIRGYYWSRDGKKILFVQDKGGDENFHVYAVSSFAKAKKGGVPEATAVTSGDKVRAFIYAVPKSMPDFIYVGLNDRDPAWHDLYKVNLNTGAKELIKENTERITGWTFDLKDNLRLATRTNEDGGTEILKVTADGFEKIYDCSIKESCNPIAFLKEDKYFYMVTNKGPKIDLTMLAKYNLSTNALDIVEVDPNKEVDFGAPIFNQNDELVGTSYTAAKRKIYWKDKKYESIYNHLQKEFEGKEVRLQSVTKDESKSLVRVFSDTDPGSIYLFDWKTKKLDLQYTVRPELRREYLSEMKPIKYKSKDGLEINAYLTLPKGKKAENLPLVINPHGGPWARDFWGYDSYAQFLANRGYAVLQPNFRASTGYGKKFLNAGNQQWGHTMQDDITAGAEYLINQGIVDKSRVGIFGISYGGYATLAGLTYTPDVYACGVSMVGPSNLKTLLESIPPYWESIRDMFYERMGNPETDEGEAILRKQSPLFLAHKIKAPLMVVQGANDPRVKQAESDQIVVACRDLGLPVEYIVAPDEGHGFARPINQKAFIASMERFFSDHLGGRFQPDMTDEIATRLKEITVDPTSVELPKEMAASTLYDAPPMPEQTLSPLADKYKVAIAIQGQSMEMDMQTTVEEEDGMWKVTDNLTSAMGNMSDVTYLDKKTLQPIKRNTLQGHVTLEIEYSDKKVMGQMNMGDTKNDLTTETQGALFAEGAGSKNVLACLPLKEGYATTFRNFDSQKKVVKIMRLEVTGKESVTVAAGTFDTYKLELKPANGDPGNTTIWVTADKQRKPVKTSSVVPAMGGAIMTAELQ